MAALLYKKDQFIWSINMSDVRKLKSIPYGKTFNSDIFRLDNFNIHMYAKLYPNGYLNHEDIGYTICLDKMPPHVKKFRFRYQIEFMEAHHIYDCITIWANNGSEVGNTYYYPIKEFNKHSTVTIKFSMQIIEIYDDKNNQILQEETKNESDNINDVTYKSVEQRVKVVESKVNELYALIESITNKFDKHKTATIGLREWLNDEVKLDEDQYYDLFIKHGIDNLEVAKLINMDILKEMGIEKIGHKMKIIHSVVALNNYK